MTDSLSFTQLPDKAGRAHAFVVETNEAGNELTSVLLLDHVPRPPLVPAALWEISDPIKEVLQLHQVKDVEDNRLTCVTFEFEGDLPEKRREYAFQLWWVPSAMELVTDLVRKWSRKDYPDNGDHDHCELTWKTISAYTGCREGYESSGDWVTVDAYNKYIRDDFLRVRGVSA